MAEIKVKLSYLRIAPRKTRLVADLIKNKKVDQAQSILEFTVKKASLPFLKLLNSAVANAKNNHQMDPSNLMISRVTVGEGPKLKRWMSRSRGAAYQIQKKTSHITLFLREIEEGKKIKKAKPLNKNAENKKEEKEVKSEKKKEWNFLDRKLPEEKPKGEKGLNKIFRRKSV